MAETCEQTMKDGDVYFWHWKKPGDFMPYHCWAQKAVVINGFLKDTYWHDGGEKPLNVDDIKAEYQGNIHEMAVIHENEIDYYRPEDVVDMRHANSSRAKIYVKQGTIRNAACMRKHIKYRIECAEREIRMAESLIERLREAEAKIEESCLDEVYL